MSMNKPPDETLKQGRNRSWLLVKFSRQECILLKVLVGFLSGFKIQRKKLLSRSVFFSKVMLDFWADLKSKEKI